MNYLFTNNYNITCIEWNGYSHKSIHIIWHCWGQLWGRTFHFPITQNGQFKFKFLTPNCLLYHIKSTGLNPLRKNNQSSISLISGKQKWRWEELHDILYKKDIFHAWMHEPYFILRLYPESETYSGANVHRTCSK